MRAAKRVLVYLAILLLWASPVFPVALQFDFLLSQVRNSTGSLAGGKVYFYAAGGSTPKDVYLDINKTPPAAANPYTLDANGTAHLYGDGNYRIVIKTAAGVTVYDRDNITIAGNPATSVTATYLNVMDHGAVGDGTTDDTAAIQDAINHAGSGTFYGTTRGGSVFFPKGDYKVTSTLTLKPGIHLIGDSTDGTRIFSYLTTGDVFAFNADSWVTGALPKNVLENFSILAKANNTTGAGIHLYGTVGYHSAVVRNVTIWCSRGDSLNLQDGVSINNTIGAVIENVLVREATRYGFYLASTNNLLTMLSNYASRGGSDGYRITATEALIFANGSDDNEGYGYYFNHLVSGMVIGNECEIPHLEAMYFYQCETTTIESNYIISDHIGGITIDAGYDCSVRKNQILKSGAPTGYCITFINAPYRLTMERGLEQAYASGTFSDETIPFIFWSTSGGKNSVKNLVIGSTANPITAHGVFDTYGDGAIGAGVRTDQANFEVTGATNSYFGVTRNAFTNRAATLYITQPATVEWDTGVWSSSTDYIVRDMVNGKMRFRAIQGTSAQEDQLVINGNVGTVSLRGHVSVDQTTAPTTAGTGGTCTLTAGSSDHAGNFVIGAGGTSCQLTFNVAFTALSCVVTGRGTIMTNYVVAATTLTVTSGPDTIDYICYGLNE